LDDIWVLGLAQLLKCPNLIINIVFGDAPKRPNHFPRERLKSVSSSKEGSEQQEAYRSSLGVKQLFWRSAKLSKEKATNLVNLPKSTASKARSVGDVCFIFSNSDMSDSGW